MWLLYVYVCVASAWVQAPVSQATTAPEEGSADMDVSGGGGGEGAAAPPSGPNVVPALAAAMAAAMVPAQPAPPAPAADAAQEVEGAGGGGSGAAGPTTAARGGSVVRGGSMERESAASPSFQPLLPTDSSVPAVSGPTQSFCVMCGGGGGTDDRCD